jgi:DNA polymerase V
MCNTTDNLSTKKYQDTQMTNKLPSIILPTNQINFSPSLKLEDIQILIPDLSTNYILPIFITPVKAGFPSPATDYEEAKLDLNAHLIAHPNATFFVHVDGDSMIDAKVQSGDIAIVDRSLEARNGDVVIAVVNNEFTMKRLEIRDRKGEVLVDETGKTNNKVKLTIQTQNTKQIRLLPENPDFEPIEITGNMTFEVWGVVTSVIHKLR